LEQGTYGLHAIKPRRRGADGKAVRGGGTSFSQLASERVLIFFSKVNYKKKACL
jgi:hypothetical protein